MRYGNRKIRVTAVFRSLGVLLLGGLLLVGCAKPKPADDAQLERARQVRHRRTDAHARSRGLLIAAEAGVDVRDGERVEAVTEEHDRVTIATSRGRTAADYVILADGFPTAPSSFWVVTIIR